nr:MAG TPA: RNA dependent RNA polymerase [Caudoviricetes sp.]
MGVCVSRSKTCQKFIYKIHSTRIRRAGWKLALPLDEARRNDEIISLADSQVLRWIDELNGITDADSQAREIQAEIRRIKKETHSVQNRNAIKRLYSDLDKIQFKPDYMCLIIDKLKDYHRACKGFTINGVKYVRLLGTNGGIKNSTIVFVSERLAPELKRRIENGRNSDKELVTAKLEAYKALACSASTPVSVPNGIAVVDDCETKFLSDIVHITDEFGDEPVMELRKDQEVVLDASDGFGIMLPSLAHRWSEALGLDYVVSGLNTRLSFEKGMIFTFDFLDFAENVAGTFLIKDAWGNEVDVRGVELILTTSMLKLWDSYESCDDYLKHCAENHYTFGITKVCPKELENERGLNYQFIQSFDLSDEDIEELIKPTMDWIRDVLGGDRMKSVLFMKGTGMGEDTAHRLDNDIIKSLMIDERMMNDNYIVKSIYAAIRNRIDRAKVGVLDVHGNYSIVSGDPFALCQSMFGLKVTGLLSAGEIYNKYWIDNSESSSLICFRAPMTCHENVRKVVPNRDDEVGYWYQYMTTCTIFNAWDTAASALNG